MNYFEFYELPESFHIDEAGVKRKFYELSKRYHPDYYANEDEGKQQEILELSTYNNKAYKVLSNANKRIEYILQLHNMLAEGDKYQLAPDFLMEMMDINEALTDVKNTEQLETIKTQIAETESGLNNELATLTGRYTLSDESGNQSLLKQILDIYYRQKYLLRIKDTLNTFAARL